ncbi:hypothetical protein LCGC14_2878320, partial [marine sediment metagenome]
VMIMDRQPEDNRINLTHVIGFIKNAEIDGDKLNLECEEIPGRRFIELMGTDFFEINPVSTGTVETRDGVEVVTNSRIQYFSMNPKPSIAKLFKSGKPIPKLAAIPESRRLPTEREIMGERFLDLD